MGFMTGSQRGGHPAAAATKSAIAVVDGVIYYS